MVTIGRVDLDHFDITTTICDALFTATMTTASGESETWTDSYTIEILQPSPSGCVRIDHWTQATVAAVVSNSD